MELGKPKCPSTQEKNPRHQDHVAMNAQVLINPLAWLRHNEQKAIVRAKKHMNLKWDKLQVNLQYTPKVHKLALI
jgi:hypothetical protein